MPSWLEKEMHNSWESSVHTFHYAFYNVNGNVLVHLRQLNRHAVSSVDLLLCTQVLIACVRACVDDLLII